MKAFLRFSLAAITVVWFGACSSGYTPHPQPQRREAFFVHVVAQPGETISAIARWFTGAASNSDFLLKHNPALDPLHLHLGDKVRIPKSWLVTTSPMPRVTLQRPVTPPGPDAFGAKYPGGVPAEFSPGVKPESPPAGRTAPANEWTVGGNAGSEAAVAPTPAAGEVVQNDPASEEKRKKIRNQVLDDIMKGQ